MASALLIGREGGSDSVNINNGLLVLCVGCRYSQRDVDGAGGGHDIVSEGVSLVIAVPAALTYAIPYYGLGCPQGRVAAVKIICRGQEWPTDADDVTITHSIVYSH